MFRHIKYFITILVLCICISNIQANAAIREADSCSRADVITAYNLASDGDIILVPEGSCLWSSYIKIEKQVTIIGAGIDNTTITLTTGNRVFWIYHDNVRIAGFTFDCDKQATSSGAILVGDYSSNPTLITRDFRIDHNRFVDCDCLRGGCTGYPAIRIGGYTYGVIDSNTFYACHSECILICADALTGLGRSTDYGQYTNGTVYIEDNTWNYTKSGECENAVDGSSASRWVVRYNKFYISDVSKVNALICNHETGYICSGSVSEGDVGTLVMEIYKNNVYKYNAGSGSILVKQRGGKSLIYDNQIHVNNNAYALTTIAKFHAWRSTDLCDGCKRGATNPRGYSGWCHDAKPTDPNEDLYDAEGRDYSKTILAEALDDSETEVDVASVADFPTYGGSIIIDYEQIDYTGISVKTLTGCIRGANATTAISHNDASDVDLLIFGECLEQITDTYIWGNKAPDGSDKNNVWVEGGYRGLPENNDYVNYDIKSYSERPDNWQYRNDGTKYSYTPYPYPHPLRKAYDGTKYSYTPYPYSLRKPSAPRNLRTQDQ